jgi:hypothetical protein
LQLVVAEFAGDVKKRLVKIKEIETKEILILV